MVPSGPESLPKVVDEVFREKDGKIFRGRRDVPMPIERGTREAIWKTRIAS